MQHVQIPHELIKLKRDGKLEQGDQVIFAAIKKYMNTDTRECFPSITTISKMLGCSRTKILCAIDRLCGCKLLEKITNKKGTHNTYKFLRTEFDEFFEMFTEDFLKMNIPLNIKEYYMGVQQFLYDKESGTGKCTFSNVELADKLGISILSVKKYNTYLIEHNYLQEELTGKTDEAGLVVVQKNFNLSTLNQAALWAKAITENVQKNNADIERLQQKVLELEENRLKDHKEMELMKKELSLYRNKTSEIDISKYKM